jgi:hypothetical protein
MSGRRKERGQSERTPVLEFLHLRRRRQALLRVARLLAELDLVAGQPRPTSARVSRVSLGSAR